MLKVATPLPTDTRSVLADWLELRALLDEGKAAGVGDLASLAKLYAEDEGEGTRDKDSAEAEDEDILESARENLLQIVCDELAYRQKVLNGSYPFKLAKDGATIKFAGDIKKLPAGQATYVFCLLATAIRDDRFVESADTKALETKIANVFQVCACLAAAGHLSGSAVSFGFPRPTRDAFLPALVESYRKFGEGVVRGKNDIPEGIDTDAIKDGGIDLVAWKDCADRMPGKLYLLGQCASGKNWTSKRSVRDYTNPLHLTWFSMAPVSQAVPAMFIPFPFHHRQQEDPAVNFSTAQKNLLWQGTQHWGIIYDRMRIPDLANRAVKLPSIDGDFRDGLDRIADITRWNSDLAALGPLS